MNAFNFNGTAMNLRSYQVTSQAIVTDDIFPGKGGRLKYQGTYWFGQTADNQKLPAGTYVKILGRNGNTLLVQRISQ